MQPEHIGSPDSNIYNSSITSTGALSASSGEKTGRTPKEKRIVEDEITKDVSLLSIIILMNFSYEFFLISFIL
jgi:ATP-dependent phosphoenolpyruvate carboxykinase